MALSIAVEHARPAMNVNIAFDAPAPGITALFGPSGAGKSTVLLAVAGLFRPDRVQVELNGEKLHRLAPHRRRIAMVFQDGRLFPHMSVERNLLYGYRRAPNSRVERRLDPADIAELLGLHPLLHRRPPQLSGGERQRVAIGRAILSQPRLLLMDEPLASLDMARRGEILPYLQRLRDQLRLPVLYVTHAIEEVQRLADHVVLLDRGQVMGAGPLHELATRVDMPLAARDDAAGILNGYVHAHEPERGLTSIACGGQVFLIPQRDISVGAFVRLRVPARDVILCTDLPRGISVNNIVSAMICAVRMDPARHAALVEIEVGGGQLLSRVTMDAADRLHLRAGLRVIALVKSMSIELLA